jgi:hypothetical protein
LTHVPDFVRGWSRRKHESNQTPRRSLQTRHNAARGSRVTRFGITVTIRIPISIRKRGGRKLVFARDGTPDTGAAVSRRIDNAMVKAIVGVFRLGKMLENSTHATIAETAAAEKINCGSSSSCSAALVLCVL